MPELNHLIVWCADKRVGAAHLVDILALDPPRNFAGLLEIITQPYGAETESSGG